MVNTLVLAYFRSVPRSFGVFIVFEIGFLVAGFSVSGFWGWGFGLFRIIMHLHCMLLVLGSNHTKADFFSTFEVG